jgi:cysteinyl-tRNA synthetase
MVILKIFNTLTREKQEIIPFNKDKITLYTCGPTVYDFAHIGNFRTYIFEDLLKRTLIFFGYKVKHVMNITDVDDKTIQGALKYQLPLEEYTDKYTEAFFEDLKTLKILPADEYPRATKYIKEMIKIIEELVKKKIAYRGNDGSIYFSIRHFPAYGKLSHLNLEDLKRGGSERVSADEYDKENASDFVLWKAYDEKRDGYIFWESPFGKGRPGWHIECSAMSLKLLGETIDLHCGGVDNIFPHHENEIAQSESFTGKEFVRCWAHSEHLIVDNKKMSKSLGNFFTLRNLLDKGYSGDQIRYLLMQVHYRIQLNFTFEGLEAAKNSLQRIHDFISRLKNIEENKSIENIDNLLLETEEKFILALADDLNISQAFASLFDFIRVVNSLIDDKKMGKNEAVKVLKFLDSINRVLSLYSVKEENLKIPIHVADMVEEREKARKNKEYFLADELREKILSEGFVIEDGPKGPLIKKK